MIYGDPGSIIALNIAAMPGEVQISVPPDLAIARKVASPGSEAVSAAWNFSAGTSFAASRGDALPSRILLQASGPARAERGMVALDRNSHLQSAPLGLEFMSAANAEITQTPPRLRCSFRGVVPKGDGVLLFSMVGWGVGAISLFTRSGSDHLECSIGRDSRGEGNFFSTVMRRPGVEQLLEVEWRDMPGAAGGTISFFIDGRPAGGPFRTKLKPRIAPDMFFSVNAALGNRRQAIDGLLVREVRIGIDRPVTRHAYLPVATGALSGALLPDLVVDARSISAPQPPRTLAWRGTDGAVATLDITVGPLAVPPGQAYKAVLEDWSSGRPVAHPHALVMTRIAAQNCRFEDGWLGTAQPPWIECLPEEPVPNIGGIDYRCEAIRCGDYVQFQFGYDWDAAAMPANPFGDPSGRNSYMIPHKWRIYDSEDLPIAVIETPDGGPLNGTDKPYLFSGRADGRGCAMISQTDRWYPHGTVRSGIIWRNRDPGSHDPAGVRHAVPMFDLSIPFGSHLDYSVNGYDLRIFSGGSGNEGQANGFGNVRVIPWRQSDYRTMTGNAGRTRDPFGHMLYSANSMAANAALWLEYTPFNIQGRSPITGTGGARDDRQIMAEPVACYAGQPDGVRPHDGMAWRTIALDYLTGYVSDPVHAFEKGRNIPLFKGNARRAIVARNHYYGPGNLGIPESQAWYQQGGRVADWIRGSGPLRVQVPYAGDTPATPYFGTFQIDKSHGHQFPGWGSLLFRTPEFAFLGHRFWDQNRLYSNDIIGDPWLDLWSIRDGAWAFMHAALAWKTASAGSQRLYSRNEVLDFTLFDFEQFHDRHYASTPGFLHPPANLMQNGKVNTTLAVYAAAQHFGVVGKDDLALFQHDFFIGYWLSALAAGEKLGFNTAIRQASPKAKAVLNWLIAMHRRRIVGRLLEAPHLKPFSGSNYVVGIWTAEQIANAGGEVSQLPRSYAALNARWGRSERWDKYIDNGQEISRDGQAMDQLIAGPSLLRYLLHQTGDDLIAAQAIAHGWREEKKREELAKGREAGSGWFAYLQATNNPAKAVQS